MSSQALRPEGVAAPLPRVLAQPHDAMRWQTRLLLFGPAMAVFLYTAWREFLVTPLPQPLYAPLFAISVALMVASVLAVRSRAASVAMASLLLVFVGAQLSLGIIDDGYISLRYARNFADGLGLVWNAGERVEGYSSFLWVWLLGALHRLHPAFDIEVTAVGLGILTSIGALLVTQRSAELLQSPTQPSSSPGTLLLLALHFPLVFWSFSGMETGLCLLLLCLAVYTTCRMLGQADAPVRGWIGASLLWVLACMTRPELTLLFGATGLFVLKRRDRLRALLAFCLPPCVIYLPYFAWRYDYYGWLFPNTYYAKVGTPFSQLPFAAKYLALGALPHVLLFPFALLALRRADTRVRYVATLALLLFATVVITGGDHFMEWRYFTYVLPLLYMLAHAELARALALPAEVPPAWQWPARALTLAGTCWVFFATVFGFQRVGINSTMFEGANGARALAALGQHLARNTPERAVLASPVIGALGYYSRRTLIDLVGLTDATIAHAALPRGLAQGPKDHARFDSAYALGRKPNYIYLFSSEPTEASFLSAQHWIPAIQDLKRYFPNSEYHYELLSGPLGRYALYVRNR